MNSLIILIACLSCSYYTSGWIPVHISPIKREDTGTCMSYSGNTRKNEIRNRLQDKVIPYLNDHYGIVCGRVGWIKVADLNMSADNGTCPLGWTLLTSHVRGCGRNGSNTIASTTFSVDNHSYTQVCGRVSAIQKGTPDAFGPTYNHNESFNGPYVDGVSLTYGPSTARKHIWTFAAAFSRNESNPTRICPCNDKDWSLQIPQFVDKNYFCESGSTSTPTQATYYTNDPLWNGQGCEGTNSKCCAFNNPPWFYATLPQTTTSDLEMRILLNGKASEENVIITEVDLYIR